MAFHAFLLAAAALAAEPHFVRHDIDDFRAGYQVAVADVTGDGRPDVIALSTDANTVAWYENPSWKRHPLAESVKNIDVAPCDLDGDGRAEVVVASGFFFGDASRGGAIDWLRPDRDTSQLWQSHRIAADPVVHRLRWGDLDGDGRPELVHAPIFGPGSKGTQSPQPSHLWAFRLPAKPDTETWPVWKIDESLTVLHGLYVGDLDGDGRCEILTASFEGIYRFDWEGPPVGGTWRKSFIAAGSPPPTPNPGAPRGSSEVAPGKCSRGRSFLAAIEPWHGHELVVYMPAAQQGWRRQVLDAAMNEGHALVVADFDGDRQDEIVVGWRGKGGGLVLFDPTDDENLAFRRVELDRAMPVEGLVAADLNGDGRLDLVANAGRINKLAWYENQGKQ